MPDQEYTCANCGETSTKGWTDEEAMAEYEATFVPDSGPLAVVCDDCYQRLMDQVRAEAPEALREMGD